MKINFIKLYFKNIDFTKSKHNIYYITIIFLIFYVSFCLINLEMKNYFAQAKIITVLSGKNQTSIQQLEQQQQRNYN